MSRDESPQDMQENEVQALKAIFNDDLKDLRSSKPWNVWNPLDILICLTPFQGSTGFQEIHAQIDLHVKCSGNYPYDEPEVILENPKGISDSSKAQLQSQLRAKCVELKGQVMVFELAQHVQQFLYEHNKPRFKSFHEEMLNRQKQVAKAKKIEETRERKFMLEEIQRRKEILKSEKKCRREHKLSINANDSGNDSSSNSFSDKTVECGHSCTHMISFECVENKTYQRGKCINHSMNGSVLFSGLDIDTGEIVAIREFILVAKDHSELTNFMKQIAGVEREFSYLITLKHNNLIHYLNMNYIIDDLNISVNIAQEFILGSTCASLFVRENIAADIDFIRHIAAGVLNGLAYLHSFNVVHKDVKDTNIFINNSGGVKLADYSVIKRLSTVSSGSSSIFGKKEDIYKFGIVILSLLNGALVDETCTEIPSSLPPEVSDFVKKAINKCEKERFSALQLLNHQFLTAPIDRMSPKRSIENILTQPMIRNQENADVKLFSESSVGQSRIQHEFEVLQFLGKGAFGDVLKVKNKLDGNDYAIKRIKLNPRNKQLNRKITREVMLLSRLNHENVVRYFNSWIETAVINADNIQSDSEADTVDRPTCPAGKKAKELDIHNDIERLAPPVKDVEWSISFDYKSQRAQQTSSSEDSDSSNDDNWAGYLSESIGFEHNSSGVEESDEDLENKHNDEVDSLHPTNREIQFMYIQMEFCEKSTLRTAIDDELHKDKQRVWRLFREILDGLAHIHQQGMIHRDLKPVNIFLDLNDHVKIGDFGLATVNILPKQQADLDAMNKSAQEKDIFADLECGLTGHIGTALYIAPELNAADKAIYNQKVDIYSLGVILFEMSYFPLKTGMERVKVLAAVRSKEIIFPEDFMEPCYAEQRKVIKLLLNHDVNQRPSSLELLQSDLLPPPVLEEFELHELVRHTLANTQSKAYKYLISSCLNQNPTTIDDMTFHMSLPQTQNRFLEIQQYVKQVVLKIFKKHGAHSLNSPLLMPKSQVYDGVDSCVNLMTRSGSVVTLPHDLRNPFARYVANNKITSLRRYAIEKVYREKKTFGFHPRELVECAFDIVSPTPGKHLADAEVISIACEIFNELPCLKQKNIVIRLNHTSIFRAILLYCGIAPDKHIDVYTFLKDSQEDKITKLQLRTHLASLDMTQTMMTQLFSYIEVEFPLGKMCSHLQALIKRKGEVGVQIRQGLQDLKEIVQNIEVMGIKSTVHVAPGLLYNIHQYSGMVCQFVCELKRKKKKEVLEILAAGGRYDNMLFLYRKTLERTDAPPQSAVGISLSLDKLVQAHLHEKCSDLEGLGCLDVVICSFGTRPMLKQEVEIIHELWESGIRCSILEANTLEEIQEQCSELNVPHIIILKDSEQGVARVRSWERDRFQEKKFSISELAESVQKLVKSWNNHSADPNCGLFIPRSDSKTGNNTEVSHPLLPVVSVNFVTSEKISASVRKRFENQILTHVSGTIERFSPQSKIDILAVQLESLVIKTLVAFLDKESTESFRKSVNSIVERHPRNKKYLIEICDEIFDLVNDKSRPIIAIYSLIDFNFKLLL